MGAGGRWARVRYAITVLAAAALVALLGLMAPGAAPPAQAAPPECTITAPTAVNQGSVGNEASVPDAGAGATYSWAVVSGDLTIADPSANPVSFDAGSASGPAQLSVEVTNPDGTCGPVTVDITVAAVIDMGLRVTNVTGDVFDETDPDNWLYTGGGGDVIGYYGSRPGNPRQQFRVEVSCLSTTVDCDGASVAIDVSNAPATALDPLWRFVTATCTPTGVSVPRGGQQIVLPDPMLAGTTAECTFYYQLDGRSSYAADGTELYFDTTLTADNAATRTEREVVTMANQATLYVDKQTNTGASNPVLDTPFDYEIEVCQVQQPLVTTDGQRDGQWYADRWTITDQLQPGVEIVDITVPNDPDMSNSTVTVTGDISTGYLITFEADYSGQLPPTRAGAYPNTRTCFDGNPGMDAADITVVYPSATFAAVPEVSNTAELQGFPANVDVTTYPPLTDDQTVTHGFDAANLGGAFGKDHTEKHARNNDVQLEEQFGWSLGFRPLSTNVPSRVEIIDEFLPDGSANYAEYFRTEHIVANFPNDQGGLEFELYYTTNLNSTEQLAGTFSPDSHGSDEEADVPRTARYQLAEIDVGPGETIDLNPDTEWITGVRLVIPELPIGATVAFYVAGHYDESMHDTIVADDDPDGSLSVPSENCAVAVQTTLGANPITRNSRPSCRTIEVLTERPMATLRKRVQGSNNIFQPGDTVTYNMTMTSSTDPRWGYGLNPVILDVLPAELTYVPDSVTYNSAWLTQSGMPEPQLEVIEDYQGSGRQALRWSWPGGERIPAGAFTSWQNRFVQYQATVNPGTPVGTYDNEVELLDSTYGIDTSYCQISPDNWDVDADGDTTESTCRSSAAVQVTEAAAMAATKWVRGDADADYVRAPELGSADPGPGGEFDYRIDFTNIGNQPITDLVMYDILPHEGDTGVSEPLDGSRNSQWTPVLTGPVSIDVAPFTVIVSYSQSTNPCRPEVYPGGGIGGTCDNDWSTAPPTDLSAVRALKFDFGTSVLEPTQGFEFTIPYAVPERNESGDYVEVNEVAWNSIAYTGSRAGTCMSNCELLIVEPVKVGVRIPPASVAGVLSFDTDGDGGQDESEGVDGTELTLVCTDVYGRDVSYGPVTTSDGTTDVDGDGTIDPPGSYYFGGLLPGSCELTVDESSLPSTWTQTLDPDDVFDGRTQVNVETGRHLTDQNFQYSDASIDVEKATNGDDADAAPGPSLSVGAPVTWTYVVTNDGTSHLKDITLTDDQLTIDSSTCVFADGRQGDVDADGDIDVMLIGESVTCTATGTAAAGPYENTASVLAIPTYVEEDPATGEPLLDADGYATALDGHVPGQEQVVDEDSSHYQGAQGGVIGDTIWLDSNGDGVVDADETGLAGVTVTLTGTDEFGNRISLTTTTNADGQYTFEGLAAGEYTVTVDLSTVTNLTGGLTHEGLEQTFDADGLGSANSSEITLAAGDVNLDQDFGYKPMSEGNLTITKDVSSPPTASGSGQYLVEYTIVVGNNGGAGISYALTDEFMFATGATVVSVEVTNSIPGGLPVQDGFDGSTQQLIAEGSLDIGQSHAYVVAVLVDVSAVASIAMFDCDTSDSDYTGFRNVATVNPSAQACAPIPPPPPLLGITGASVTTAVIIFAVLAGLGVVLFIVSRRRQRD